MVSGSLPPVQPPFHWILVLCSGIQQWQASERQAKQPLHWTVHIPQDMDMRRRAVCNVH